MPPEPSASAVSHEVASTFARQLANSAAHASLQVVGGVSGGDAEGGGDGEADGGGGSGKGGGDGDAEGGGGRGGGDGATVTTGSSGSGVGLAMPTHPTYTDVPAAYAAAGDASSTTSTPLIAKLVGSPSSNM